MNRRTVQTIARQLADLSADAGAERPDADLLGRFVAGRDQAAFAALVRRHGPMVWASCRHLLPNPADAEDAFQATFLALAQQAKRVRNVAALGGWLHGVAVRAALKIRRSEARRKGRERATAGPEVGRPVPDSAWDGLLAAVHEEVERLPVALRTAFVLCDLEGVPQPTAAARLGWKPGTLTGRLTRARQSLMARLTSRGLAPAVAAGGVGTAASGGAVPPALNQTVLMLAGDPVRASAAVTALVTEVTAMTLTKVKLLAAGLMVAGGLGLGVGSGRVANLTAQTPAPEPPATADPPAAPRPAQPPKPVPAPMAKPALAGTAKAGPIRTTWEYRYAAAGVGGPTEFAKLFDEFGAEGWEFAGAVTDPFNEAAMAEIEKAAKVSPGKFAPGRYQQAHGLLVFKRPKAPANPAKGLPALAIAEPQRVEIELSGLGGPPGRPPVPTERRATAPPAAAAPGTPVAMPPGSLPPAQPAASTYVAGSTLQRADAKPRTPAPEPIIVTVRNISLTDASSLVQLCLEDVREMRVQTVATTNTLVLFNVPPAAAARVTELLKRVDVAPATLEERPIAPSGPPVVTPGSGGGRPRGSNPLQLGKPTPPAKPVPPPIAPAIPVTPPPATPESEG